MRKLLIFLSAAVLLSCCSRQAEVPHPDAAIQLPTMGWSSWNTYRVHISDSLIMAQADAMVSTGLAEAGYNHINIDDGYFGGRDAATGRLLVHPTRFPGGLKPVVDHIHALGLKAGIYSDAGSNTCGSMYDRDTIARGVGFYGHDRQDAEFFFREMVVTDDYVNPFPVSIGDFLDRLDSAVEGNQEGESVVGCPVDSFV